MFGSKLFNSNILDLRMLVFENLIAFIVHENLKEFVEMCVTGVKQNASRFLKNEQDI